MEFKEYSIIDKPKPSLDPQLFEDDKIKPNLRKKILQQALNISEKFNLKVNKVWGVGSIFTKQYRDDSDVDITLFIDEHNPEKLKDLNLLINSQDQIFIGEHPVNFHFVSGKFFKYKADAIYDLLKDKWIKKSEPLSEQDIKNIIKNCKNVKEFNDIMTEFKKLKDLLNNYSEDNLEHIINQAMKVNHMFYNLKDLRRSEFNKRNKDLPSGNFSCSNIIFKLLENYGLLNLASLVAEKIKNAQ